MIEAVCLSDILKIMESAKEHFKDSRTKEFEDGAMMGIEYFEYLLFLKAKGLKGLYDSDC